MKRPYEFQMSDPVSEWLRSRGCRVYAEVIVHGATIDLVGIDGEMPGHQVHSVELKRGFSAAAFGQVSYHQHKSHYSWIAAFAKPRAMTMEYALAQGIGLLRVEGDAVQVLLEARLNNLWRHPLMVRRAHEGGLAGKATGLGKGPAQQVYEAVQAYRVDHPDARWLEIYLAVPNHYTSANSMGSALGKHKKRLDWKERNRK